MCVCVRACLVWCACVRMCAFVCVCMYVWGGGGGVAYVRGGGICAILWGCGVAGSGGAVTA